MFYSLCICFHAWKTNIFNFSILFKICREKIQEFRKLKQNFPDKNLNRRNNQHTSNLKDYTLNYVHHDDRYQQQGYYRSLHRVWCSHWRTARLS